MPLIEQVKLVKKEKRRPFDIFFLVIHNEKRDKEQKKEVGAMPTPTVLSQKSNYQLFPQ